MKWKDLLASDTPVEFCIAHKDFSEPHVWCTSHPKGSTPSFVLFYTENGGWWGRLYLSGRITDTDEDPFELAEAGTTEIRERSVFGGSKLNPFPFEHEYPLEDISAYLDDEIPF